jgi:hypothetical protein
MLKQVLLLLPVCFWVLGASLQAQNINPQIDGITLAPLTTTGKKIDGNAFFYDNWTEGAVAVTLNGNFTPLPKMKYDIASDKVLFQNEVGIFEFPAGSLWKFSLKILDEKTARIKNYIFTSGLEGFSKYTPSNFFEILYESPKIKFLKKHFAELKQMSASTYGSRNEEYTYVKNEEFYIYKDNKGILVKKNKKSVLEALGGDTKKLEAFVKDNQLNLKKEDDIIALIKYYEKLQ